ncbi:unnamed protein product [Heligmosomoides polygyrus]|uniref:Nup54 domain-containing protein n=1 Tax=Heligmosomoides polygyrus TaxID=6339 RepID=A0A3P8CBG3_HELPZ|nr:unnamed protein product [Heligmosomoides polygyrus]
MSSDIHQMGGFYDAATQQNAFKAMSQMWQMDQYQQGYSMKDVQTPTAFPHPFANFAQQLSTITQTMRETPPCSKKKPNPVPVEMKDEDNLRLKAELQRVLMELERLKYMAAVQGVQL